MLFAIKMLLIFIVFLAKSAGETCLRLLSDGGEGILLPNRIRRYNPKTKEIDILNHIKEDMNSLCSIDPLYDLKGKLIRVAVDENSPYVIFKDHKLGVTGFIGDVWTELQQVLEFSNLYLQFRYDTPLERSHYVASIDASILKTGKYDVFLSASIMERNHNNHFVHAALMERESYSPFTLSEGTHVPTWWYAQIFSADVWLLSLLFIALLTIVVMLVFKWQRSLCQREIERINEFGNPSHNLICIIGASSGQGFQSMPSSWSLRICTITALHMGMLLSCSFNSTLTSSLAFRSHYVKINSLDNALDIGTHSICVRTNALGHKNLMVKINSSDLTLSEKKKRAKLVNKGCPNMDKEEEVLPNLCQRGFIYVETHNRFLSIYRQLHNKCQLMKISEGHWTSTFSFLHHGGSRFRGVLDNYLIRLRSAGILIYLRRKWLNQDWPKSQFYTLQKVELGHIQNLFIGYIIAAVFSGVICVLENIWFKFSRKKSTRFVSERKEVYHDLIVLSWKNNQNLIDFVALPTNLKNVLRDAQNNRLKN